MAGSDTLANGALHQYLLSIDNFRSHGCQNLLLSEQLDAEERDEASLAFLLHAPAHNQIDLLVFGVAFCLTPFLSSSVFHVIGFSRHECESDMIFGKRVHINHLIAIETFKYVSRELALAQVGQLSSWQVVLNFIDLCPRFDREEVAKAVFLVQDPTSCAADCFNCRYGGAFIPCSAELLQSH